MAARRRPWGVSLHHERSSRRATPSPPSPTLAAGRGAGGAARRRGRRSGAQADPAPLAGRGQRSEPGRCSRDAYRRRQGLHPARRRELAAGGELCRQLCARHGPPQLPRRDQERGAARRGNPGAAGRGRDPVHPLQLRHGWPGAGILHARPARAGAAGAGQAAARRHAGHRSAVPRSGGAGRGLARRGRPAAAPGAASRLPRGSERRPRRSRADDGLFGLPAAGGSCGARLSRRGGSAAGAALGLTGQRPADWQAAGAARLAWASASGSSS